MKKCDKCGQHGTLLFSFPRWTCAVDGAQWLCGTCSVPPVVVQEIVRECDGSEDMPPALVNPKGSPNPIDDIKAVDEKKLFVELCRKYLPELRINPDTGMVDPGPACELAQDLDNLMEHYGCIFCVHVNLMFSESYDLNNSGEAYGLRV